MGCQMGQGIEYNVNFAFDGVSTSCVSPILIKKYMKCSETQTLESLMLVSSPKRKCSFHFSRFIQIVINLVPKWASNWCAWAPLRPESEQKLGLENIAKNAIKSTRDQRPCAFFGDDNAETDLLDASSCR